MRYRKLLLIVMILASLAMALTTYNVSAWTTPPTPTLVNINPNGAEGDWYIGAIPPSYDPAKPVLVFVQGLHGKASDWWGPTVYSGNNDMYAYAYNYGYRTAFVNFRDADGNAGSMWLNGSDLRNQLAQICAYFGVAKVNIICHSKGGVDTQSAIVHYGAYPYVNKVFTLSTPHSGSQLADLAYSWFAGWLASLLGQKDDGTYVLQTSYMSYFRSVTDNRTENNTISYYTSGGTDWGPFLSALYCGGIYLSAYGSNDGLVTVTSAHNPRATHINTGSYNHDNIRLGSKSWWYIEPQIRTYTASALTSSLTAATSKTAATFESTTAPDQPGNFLLRGGEITPQSTAVANVPVESGVNSIIFDLLTSSPTATVKIVSPRGDKYFPDTTYADTEFFNGATHYTIRINQPVAGNWRIKIQSPVKDAYMLYTWFDSPLQTKLTASHRKLKTGSSLDLNWEYKGQSARQFAKTNASAILCRVKGRNRVHKLSEQSMTSSGAKFGKTLTMPQEPGLYNVNLSLSGTLDDGTVFERSQVYSVMVDSDTLNGDKLLKDITGQEK